MEKQAWSAADSDILRLVLEGTVSQTGRDFFRALVKNLATALGTAGAWVTEYLPEPRRLRALGMWLNGRYVEHYEYAIAGTPCESVVCSKSLIHFPENIIALFPGDNDLKPVNAVSYLGAPLLDTNGEVLGHLSVLDTKPMPADPKATALFEIFAARATAEHRRLKAELELRAREEQLARLLESAMDAILVIDAHGEVIRVNPAGERLFACSEEDLLGEKLNEFVTRESAVQLEAFVKDLESQPANRQQLWVSFIARRWDHTVFPADATLSRFESRTGVFYTLILRNTDERLQAERRIQLLIQETDYLRDAVRELPGHGELLGRSNPMLAVLDAVRKVAPTDSTVLITGETGIGKEVVARAIHRTSSRSEKPLVLVNCAAIPANLQAKLLRVVQEGEFEPLGGSRTVKVNVRVIAATNRELKQLTANGRFREDLYFRLHVFPIHLPPLRQRGKDIELLADTFIQRFARRMGKHLEPLTSEQLSLLRSYDWPGNVRELQNVIERAIILASGPRLQLERAMTGTGLTIPAPATASEPIHPSPPPRILTSKEFLELERDNLLRALEACQWRVSGDQGAARLLTMPPSTLGSRMKALGIARPRRSTNPG